MNDSSNPVANPAPKTRPLHVRLQQLVVALVVVTSGAIGLSTYLNTRAAVRQLAEARLRAVKDQITDKTKDFLGQAEPLLTFTRGVAEQDQGFADAAGDSPEAGLWARRAGLLRAALESTTHVRTVFFGSREGEFISVTRTGPGVLLYDRRWLQNGKSRRYLTQVGYDGVPEVLETEPLDFDPRKRPWYEQAVNTGRLTWTEPYLFAGTQQPGVTAALPLKSPGGEVAGVFGADFRLDELVEFVDGLRVGEQGKAFLLTGDVREFRPAVIEAATDPPTLAPASQSADPLLSAAASVPHAGQLLFTAEGVHYLGARHWFQMGDEMSWTIIIAIPEREVLGAVQRNNLITLAVCLGIGLLAVLVFSYVARQITQPLREIAADMREVGDLVLTEEPPPASAIREVHEMGQDLHRMKAGLRSFEKYVPTDVVRLVIQSGQEARLGGETTRLTVFFSDVVGFTSLAEQMSPEDLVASLGRYLDRMDTTIHGHGGIVDKYIGDAVMAFWDAPIRPEEHPERQAGLAALACLQVTESGEDKPLQANIGLHTGEAVVGNIGSPRRLNYTAIGDAVNVASRIEGLNRVYGTRILVSEETRQPIRDEFEFREIDTVAVKGRRASVRVYELLAESGELNEAQREMRDLFEQGLELYRSRDFARARERFVAALALSPDDGPSRVFIKRCEEYELSPPSGDWAGIYTASEK